MLVCGIDEAGKGPVIGPLVIAGAMFEEEDLPKLKKIGVKDSKLLSINKINELAKEVKKIAKFYKIILVQPKEIDNAVEGNDGLNLNWLEGIKQTEIINELKPDKVIIDCPSPNLKVFRNFILKNLEHKPKSVIVEHKADFFHSCVSAASILAKCKREEEVEKIEKMVGESIGSGYPSNPVCQRFLKNNYEKYPDLIRKSWSTYKVLIDKKNQKTLVDF